MSTFIKQLKTQGLLLVGALGLFAGSNVFAATAPGTVVTNSVDVDYTVGSVAQTTINQTQDITVDRLIDISLSTLEAGDVAITPGAANAPALMNVTNNGNDDFDINLSAAAGGTATAPFTAVDGTDTNGAFLFYIDDGDGVFEPTTDDAPALTTISNLQDVDSGANSIDFWVDDGVPNTVVDGEEIVNTLTIQVAEVGGANITTDDSGSPNVEDTQEDLFGTELGVNNDGTIDFGIGYVVSTAIITVTKTVTVISDPVNGVSANAKAIPGAVVEWTITVSNDALATASADNVDVVDAIVANTTYVASSITLNAGGQTDAADFPATDNCDSGGGATITCQDVSDGDGTLDPGDTATITFQVTID